MNHYVQFGFRLIQDARWSFYQLDLTKQTRTAAGRCTYISCIYSAPDYPVLDEATWLSAGTLLFPDWSITIPKAPCWIMRCCNKSNPRTSRAYYRKRGEGPLGKHWNIHVFDQRNEAEARAHTQELGCCYGVPSLVCCFVDTPHTPRIDNTISR